MQNSDPGGGVSGQTSSLAFSNFSTGSSMGAVPIEISVEKLLTRLIPGRAVIQRPSQRELSSSRIVPQRARGHPMRNSACMQSIHRV